MSRSPGDLESHEIDIYAHELLYLLARFEAAADRFGDYGKRVGRGELLLEGDIAWDDVDRMISLAARVADVLWPAQHRGNASRRASQLRQRFGLGSTSPLQLRATRNSAEHFAERLDDFLSDRDESWVYGSMVWTHDHRPLGLTPNDFGRYFDMDGLVAYVFGAPIELRRVREEMRDVGQRVQAWRTNFHAE